MASRAFFTFKISRFQDFKISRFRYSHLLSSREIASPLPSEATHVDPVIQSVEGLEQAVVVLACKR